MAATIQVGSLNEPIHAASLILLIIRGDGCWSASFPEGVRTAED